MSLDYAKILYLTPEFSACNVVSAPQLSNFLVANPATTYRSNVPIAFADTDPVTFFSANARKSVQVIRFDTLIRGSNTSPTSPSDGASFIPNIYAPATIDDSNTVIVYSSNTDIEQFHLSNDYYVRFRYDTGAIMTPKVVSIVREPTRLILDVEGPLLESSGSTGMQGMLQGIFVKDAGRLKDVVASAHSNIVVSVSSEEFNPDLYRMLYPETSTLDDAEAFQDFTARSNANIVRIGKTSQLALSATALASTVLPSLSVTGNLTTNELTLDAVTVTGISTNYVSAFAASRDDYLITERAAKRFVETPRDAQLLDLMVKNLRVESNVASSSLSASNASLSNVISVGVSACNVSGSNLFVRDGTIISASSSNATACNVSCQTLSASNVTVSTLNAGSVLLTSNGIWASVPVSLSNSLTASNVFCSNVATQRVTATNGIITALACSNAAFSNLSTQQVVGDTCTFSNVTAATRLGACNILASNLQVSSNIAANTIQTGALTATTLINSNLWSSNSVSSTIVAGQVTASNAAASNVVAGSGVFTTLNAGTVALSNVTASNLDVKGQFTFPISTFVATSNLVASTLRVDTEAFIAKATVDTQLATKDFSCREFILKYGDEPRSLARGLTESDSGNRCAQLLQGLTVTCKQGVPTLDPQHPFSDRQLVELCIGTLQHLLRQTQ